MGTAFRYYTKELLVIFGVVFGVLLVISLGGRFTGYLQEAASGRISSDVLWLLMGLRIPEFISIIVPFALFLSTLITLGRLHADQEYTVLIMGGVGPSRVLVWTAAIAVPLSLIVGYVSLVSGADARRSFVEIVFEQRTLSEFDALTPDTFRTFSNGQRASYMATVDRENRKVGGVFLNTTNDDGWSSIFATEGVYHMSPTSGKRYLELRDGQWYRSDSTSHGLSMVEFDSMTQRLDLDNVLRRHDDVSTLPTAALNLSEAKQAVEWHWRIALPLMTLIAALCALGIAKVRPRSGRFGKFVPGLGLIVAYYAAVLLCQNVMTGNVVLQWIGLWPAHLIFLLVGWGLIVRSSRPA